MEWKELRAALRGLTVYREELETEIGRAVTGLLDALYRQDGEGALDAYTGLFAALRRDEFQGLGTGCGTACAAMRARTPC